MGRGKGEREREVPEGREKIHQWIYHVQVWSVSSSLDTSTDSFTVGSPFLEFPENHIKYASLKSHPGYFAYLEVITSYKSAFIIGCFYSILCLKFLIIYILMLWE